MTASQEITRPPERISSRPLTLSKRLRIVAERRGLIPVSTQLLRGRDHACLHSFADHHGAVRRDTYTKISHSALRVHRESSTGGYCFCGKGALAALAGYVTYTGRLRGTMGG